jgi:hypothetical protein
MFRTFVIGLPAIALLGVGAAAFTPTTASAHDYEWEHYCYHHPYDPLPRDLRFPFAARWAEQEASD